MQTILLRLLSLTSEIRQQPKQWDSYHNQHPDPLFMLEIAIRNPVNPFIL
jgi:hypothetical protein